MTPIDLILWALAVGVCIFIVGFAVALAIVVINAGRSSSSRKATRDNA